MTIWLALGLGFLLGLAFTLVILALLSTHWEKRSRRPVSMHSRPDSRERTQRLLPPTPRLGPDAGQARPLPRPPWPPLTPMDDRMQNLTPRPIHPS